MKTYYLEEVFYYQGEKFWSKIIESKDIRQLKKLKKIYEEKDKYGIYRIVEVK